MAGEDAQLPHQAGALRQHSSHSSTLDAKPEAVDEQRVEDGVEQHGEYGGIHGHAGMACRAQHGIEAKVHVGEDIAVEYPLHVLAGIRQGLDRCTEEEEYGIEQQQDNSHEEDAHHDVERHGVAEEALRSLMVLLPETHGDHGAGTHADHSAKGGTEVHQRERDGQARDGHRPYPTTDEHGVDHVVQRGGCHGDDGRDSVLHEQLAYGLGTQFTRAVGHNGC